MRLRIYRTFQNSDVFFKTLALRCIVIRYRQCAMLKTFGRAHTFRIKHKWAKNFSIHLEVSQYTRLKIYSTFQNSDQCVLQYFGLEMDGDLLSPVLNVEDCRPRSHLQHQTQMGKKFQHPS